MSTGPPAACSSCRPRYRTGRTGLDQPSVGARSQLGTCRACNMSVTMGRVELPRLTARRSDRRVSTSSTTWSFSSPDQPSVGARNRTRLTRSRVWYPMPIDERAMLSVRRAGVEPANPQGMAGLRPVGLANAQSSHVLKWRRRESNPQSPRFGLGRFAGLRTAPCSLKAPSTGFGPAISCVTGRRALQAAPRGHVHVQVAQVGVEPTASLVLSQGGLPVAYRAEVVPDGVEPSFPGCGPRVVAVGPRDRVSQVESPGVAPESPACHAGVFLLDHDPNVFSAEAVGLEPTSGSRPPPVFRTGSSSGRMASIVKLRRLELNQHEDVQSVSSYR